MITLCPGSKLVQSQSELPDFTRCKRLFMDFETKNISHANFEDKKFAKKYGGMYPFKGDRIAGIAVTADDCPDAYYIPVRHNASSMYPNIPLDIVQTWLKDHVTKVEEWVNHNVIFDATFAHFEGAEFRCKIVDTLSLSKIHDSDRLGHGLKELARDWLGLPMEEEIRIQAYLEQMKVKDYAAVPADIMGEYACMDVRANRQLFEFLLANRPAELEGIWNTEIALSAVLYDMEVEGLRIDPQHCKMESLKCLRRLIDLSTRIEQMTGREWTNSSDCVYDILCNQFGLPVLMTRKERLEGGEEYDTGNPTFNKDALALYEVHPAVTSDPKLLELVRMIRMYRKEAQHKSLFLDAFLQLHDENNRIHPSYNQIVRTGRMSCSRPNAQQQNPRSKALVLPDEGCGYVSADYSQIEYRLIAHYIQDEQIIRAYHENPDVDFHQWVADMLHVKRKAGKTLNFGMAYGAGKKRVTAGLVSNPDIIEEVGEMVNKMVEKGDLPPAHRTMVFNRLCAERAAEVYNQYHERVPGIKRTSREAARVCAIRGYVFNAYGRRRHLPQKASHKAFNSIIQGCAMDIMKERMVALSPRYNERSRELGLRLRGNVHDEVFMVAPISTIWKQDGSVNEEFVFYVTNTLETPSIPFRVPIRTGLGISDRHWGEAAGDYTRFSDGTVIDLSKEEYKGNGFPVAGCIR